MSLLDAFILSMIGIAIVFVVLVVLMLIIQLMGLIAEKSPAVAAKMPKLFKNKKKSETAAETPVADAEKAKGTCGELVLIDTDERDAAMIMAIVADSTGTPLNELRFKSIKQILNEEKEN